MENAMGSVIQRAPKPERCAQNILLFIKIIITRENKSPFTIFFLRF